MRTLPFSSVGGVCIAFVAVLASACSFITDFREIETLSEGGAGGNNVGGSGGGGGGDGGGEDCGSAEACLNCLSDAGSCPPINARTFPISAPPSEPAQMNTVTSATITDIVGASNGIRYIGAFRDEGGNGLLAAGQTLSMGNQQAGFVLGGDGRPIFGAGACDDDGTQGGDEVVFSAATVTADTMVVTGMFEGGRMVFFSDTMDCMDTTVSLNGPATSGQEFVPFIFWTDPSADTLNRSLEPGTENGSDNGYLADIAGAPRGAPGQVVAIGVAARDPFGMDAIFDDTFRYYVISTSGPVPTALVPLTVRPCQAAGTLDGLRSSIAFDVDGSTWVAGTGCPLEENLGPDQSFLSRFTEGVTLTGLNEKSMGSATNPMGITDVVVSADTVIVAGTYSGLPIEQLADGSPVPAGDDGDGFVMAFSRAEWSNQDDPIWFVRIQSDIGPATIGHLTVLNGLVSVTGSIDDGGGIGSSVRCFSSTPPGMGRAFVAQLSETSGALEWMRVDGFEATDAGDATNYFARGTALYAEGKALLTAMSTHGELLLGCDDSSTNNENRPEIFVRLFDLP
jgi:hypothetical protein